HQRLAAAQVILNVIAIKSRLPRVGCEDHYHLRLVSRGVDACDGKSDCLRGVTAARVLAQPDDDVDSTISQIQRVRVSLAAVADDRYSPSLETADIRVSVVIKFCHVEIPSACDHQARVASSGPAAFAPR